ncbi:MAG: sulfurtransferase TusA [Endozoicomonadaceae bacterium]|nr:sulfurtransferase TusA [Endozoicomonadaceae bacterium]
MQSTVEHLDVSGLKCPEPIMLLHQKINKMASNHYLALIATDPTSWRDIPKFCCFLGHILLKKTQEKEYFYYLIRKK